jgi:predicted nucleic-acid-binding Zn-ribbon protein
MRFRLALIVLCVLALALGGCGPTSAHRDNATAGMCPQCGGTNLDVQRQTVRSPFDGSETEMLAIACRGCGYSWSTPAR